MHQEEKKKIDFDETKIANIKVLQDVIPDVIPNGYQMDTQVRIGKDRLDKERLELDKVNNHNNTVPVENKKSLSKIFKDSEIKLNERHLQMIYEYIALDHFTVPMIQYAVERTEDAGSTSFNYLNKILKNWKEKGYKSLEEVENDDRAFEEKKKEQANNRTKDFKTGKYALLGTDISVHEIDPELGF